MGNAFPLTKIDKLVLPQTDEEYQYHDWDELKQLIGANKLETLKRKPSQLRKYMDWTAETKANYGSMTRYLLGNRLPKTWGSPPFTPTSTIPFKDPSDYRVLVNDWPYGVTPDIVHLIVWSRTPIATDPETGDLTPESRQITDSFVKRYFADTLGPRCRDRVLWFKNWAALQSVRELEHIHVLVKDVDQKVVDSWTEELDCH